MHGAELRPAWRDKVVGGADRGRRLVSFPQCNHGGMHGDIGLPARGLHAQESGEPTVHPPHHGDGLGPAAQNVLRRLARLCGGAEAVHGVEMGADDLGGEQGLGGIDRAEGGDGGGGELGESLGDVHWLGRVVGGGEMAVILTNVNRYPH